MHDAWRLGEGQESSDSHHMIITSQKKTMMILSPLVVILINRFDLRIQISIALDFLD